MEDEAVRFKTRRFDSMRGKQYALNVNDFAHVGSSGCSSQVA